MRPSKDETWLAICQTLAERSTCLRRKVGCVLLDWRGHVLSTGYNGVAPGEKHCNEVVNILEPAFAVHEDSPNTYTKRTFPYACSGAQLPSGQGLDSCRAIHAEQNALLQCRDPWMIHTCYSIASPCVTCVKLLMSTSCTRIVFLEEYPHPEARTLWWPREWVQGNSTTIGN